MMYLNSGSVSPKLTSSRLTSLEYKSHVREEWYLSRHVWEELGKWHYVPVYYLELMLACTRHPGGAEVFPDCNASSTAHNHKNWKPRSCVYWNHYNDQLHDVTHESLFLPGVTKIFIQVDATNLTEGCELWEDHEGRHMRKHIEPRNHPSISIGLGTSSNLQRRGQRLKTQNPKR
jgi:hypothetical protein